jgi:hypothetical protein
MNVSLTVSVRPQNCASSSALSRRPGSDPNVSGKGEAVGSREEAPVAAASPAIFGVGEDGGFGDGSGSSTGRGGRVSFVDGIYKFCCTVAPYGYCACEAGR